MNSRSKADTNSSPSKIANLRSKKVPRFSDFKYTNHLLTTSQSVNNTDKLGATDEPMRNSSYPNLSKVMAESPKERKTRSVTKKETISFFTKSDPDQEFLVNSKKPESCYSVQTKGKYPEVELMVAQVIQFLNAKIFKSDELKGIVLDFIQNKEKV